MKKSKEPKCRLRQSAAGDTCTGVRPSDVSLSSLLNVTECIEIMFIKVNLTKLQHTFLSHHPHHHPIHKDKITNPRMGGIIQSDLLKPRGRSWRSCAICCWNDGGTAKNVIFIASFVHHQFKFSTDRRKNWMHIPPGLAGRLYV